MRALFVTLGSFCLFGFAACADESEMFTSNNPANCAEFCTKLVECDPEETIEACGSNCVGIAQQANAVSSACLSAFGAVNSCVSGLTCEQGQAWFEEIPPDAYPCKAEDDAASAACNPG
ncbi:MAG: hypothetical protein ACN4G0_10040 [Polyangiales bacterium]